MLFADKLGMPKKIKDLAESLDLEVTNHHDPEFDAKLCALIFGELTDKYPSYQELIRKIDDQPKTNNNYFNQPSEDVLEENEEHLSNYQITQNELENIDLIGKGIVITGNFSIEREEIKTFLMKIGGQIKSGITGKAHIRNKLASHNLGYKVVVMGWFEFLLKHWITPFKTTLFPHLIDTHLGVSFVNGKSGLKSYNEKIFATYKKDNYRKKYLTTEEHKVFSDKLSELANELYLKNPSELTERLNSIFDYLYFDECQDFVGYDYEIIKLILTRTGITCVFAGDPRQHTYSTHTSSKYKKYSGDIASFIQDCVNKKNKRYVTIDETTLVKSHRCPRCICDFASLIMPQYPEMKSVKENSQQEHCLLIKNCDVGNYVDRFNPVALIWNNKALKNIHPNIKQRYNMGEVKGLDFPNVIVYPTENMLTWINNTTKQLADETRAKLYVAVTRAEITIGIIVPDDFCLPSESILQFWSNPD